MKTKRHIALFGGTFDPVHLGHIHLAEEAKRNFNLDEVRFIPCRISPHKLTSTPSSAANRLEMLRLATADYSWALVDELELDRDSPSYSWQTAETIAASFPDDRLFWIMGADQWETLPKWAEPERLAKVVEFIVFHRDALPQPRHGYMMHPMDSRHPASATLIRKAITEGESNHLWLNPNVSRWICDHGLYR